MNENKKKFLKYSLNILLIVVITIIALSFIFNKNDARMIGEKLVAAKKSFLLVGVALMVVFVCSESVIMRYLLIGFKAKLSLGKCILLSNIGFFFCSITPSATGGQPVQIFYMAKCGVDSLVSTLVCIVITLVYKFTLMVLCIAFFILAPEVTFEAVGHVPILFTLGCILEFGFMIFLIFCICKPAITVSIIKACIKFGGKIRLIKKTDELLEKAMKSVQQYEKAAQYIKEHVHVLFVSLGITLIQRLAYFSVTFMVAKALSIDCSWVEIVAIQVIISLSVDALPLPGATGAAEGVFMILQAMIFGEANVASGLLLNRGITFYALTLVTGALSLVGHFYFKKVARQRAELSQIKVSINEDR